MRKIILIVTLIMMLIVSSPNILAAEEITIAGGSVGGSWFPVANAIAELLNKEVGESIATAKPGGGVSNPPMVSQGTVSAGFSYSSYLVAAQRGEDPYEGQKIENISSVVELFPMYLQIIGDASLPYDTLGEYIENQYPIKMCPTKPGHGDFWVTEKVFSIIGIDFKDIESWGGKIELGGGGEMTSFYKDRHIDMAFSHNVVPFSAYTDMSVSRNSKLIGVDQDIIDKLNEKYGMKEGIIPAGTYKGTDVDIKSAGMPAVLFIHNDISEDIVYSLTKAICENAQTLSSLSKDFERFDPSSACKDLGIDLHPGAKKYYQEMGYLD